jgi:hypothetical protein
MFIQTSSKSNLQQHKHVKFHWAHANTAAAAAAVSGSTDKQQTRQEHEHHPKVKRQIASPSLAVAIA